MAGVQLDSGNGASTRVDGRRGRRRIRLSGCLVRGHDGEGYLLTNVPGEAAWQRAADATVVPDRWERPERSRAFSTGSQRKTDSTITSVTTSRSTGKVLGNLQDGEIKITPRGSVDRSGSRERRQVAESPGAPVGADHPGDFQP